MAIVSCEACQNNISENATTCPHCGEPAPIIKTVAAQQQPGTGMWIASVLMLIFAIISVGQPDNLAQAAGSLIMLAGGAIATPLFLLLKNRLPSLLTPLTHKNARNGFFIFMAGLFIVGNSEPKADTENYTASKTQAVTTIEPVTSEKDLLNMYSELIEFKNYDSFREFRFGAKAPQRYREWRKRIDTIDITDKTLPYEMRWLATNIRQLMVNYTSSAGYETIDTLEIRESIENKYQNEIP